MKRQTALLMLAFCMLAGAAQGVYVVGDTIADFTRFDAYGNEISLYDFSNMVIVMTFWQPT